MRQTEEATGGLEKEQERAKGKETKRNEKHCDHIS